jgi:hypothetical protein
MEQEAANHGEQFALLAGDEVVQGPAATASSLSFSKERVAMRSEALEFVRAFCAPCRPGGGKIHDEFAQGSTVRSSLPRCLTIVDPHPCFRGLLTELMAAKVERKSRCH